MVLESQESKSSPEHVFERGTHKLAGTELVLLSGNEDEDRGPLSAYLGGKYAAHGSVLGGLRAHYIRYKVSSTILDNETLLMATWGPLEHPDECAPRGSPAGNGLVH